MAGGSGDAVQGRDAAQGSGTMQVSKGKTIKKKKKNLQKLRRRQAGVVSMKGGDVHRGTMQVQVMLRNTSQQRQDNKKKIKTYTWVRTMQRMLGQHSESARWLGE